MRRWYIAVLGMSLLMAADANAQFARQEVVPFESASTSVSEILKGDRGSRITLAGILRAPKRDGRQPVVILMHGAAGLGISGPLDVWSAVLSDAGIATFTVDSFAGRGANTQADVSKIHPLSRLPDAFGAYEVLAKHPLIDPSNIAVMGFSHGSVAAVYSNTERFQKQFGAHVMFAAHISMYGLCGTTFREDDRVVGRLLVLHGADDNFVPAAPCRDYVARLQRAGAAVRMIEYAGTYHLFDGPAAGPLKVFQDRMMRAGKRGYRSATTMHLRRKPMRT